MNNTAINRHIRPMTRDVSRAWDIMQTRCERDRAVLDTLSEAWTEAEEIKRRRDLTRVRELLTRAVAAIDKSLAGVP